MYVFNFFSIFISTKVPHKRAVIEIGINETVKNSFQTVCYYHATYEFQSESTLYSLPECQGTPCSKQASYLKFKRQQRDSDPQPLSS